MADARDRDAYEKEVVADRPTSPTEKKAISDGSTTHNEKEVYEPARRASVALNIIDNPLQVCMTTFCPQVHY